MTSTKEYLKIEKKQIQRFEKLYEDYRLMYECPAKATPKIIINPPIEQQFSWAEKIANPEKMLIDELNNVKPHLELEDDRVPSVRVQFGTGQVASAFGCQLTAPTDSLPCVATHVLDSGDIDSLVRPSLESGWFGKVADYTKLFKANLPDAIKIQHPDIQGPFNTAHLIRGNDILYDLYDNPDRVGQLLDIVTDYMLELVPYLKEMIADEYQEDYFFDWGSMWKGTVGMRNCTTHLISPAQYEEFVLPRDQRLLRTLGGGRMHYCGSYSGVIEKFFQVDCITGLDYDSQYHNLWEIADKAPEQTLLSHWIMDRTIDTSLQRLLEGDWPDKRNIIIIVNVESMDEGYEILKKLKKRCYV